MEMTERDKIIINTLIALGYVKEGDEWLHM